MRVIKILVENLSQCGDIMNALGEAELEGELDFSFSARFTDELSVEDAQEVFSKDWRIEFGESE